MRASISRPTLDSDEKRSAVERQFLIVGEAVAALRRQFPELAESISQSRFIAGSRNMLAHDYAAVDDEAVYSIAMGDFELYEMSRVLHSAVERDA